MEANDQNRILEMLRDGKITVEEASGLLSALDPKPAEAVPVKDTRGRKRSKLRLIVDTGDPSDSAKVNVNIPLSLIKTVGPLVARNMPTETREKLGEKGVDLNKIFDEVETLLNSGVNEDIVNIDVGDEGDKAKVRIYVE